MSAHAAWVSYPAFRAFFADPGRTPARVCVYMALQPTFLCHVVPADAKVEAVRAAARVSTRSTIDALAWLERRGYVVVHGRDRRGVLSLTLAWDAPDEDSLTPEQSA